MNTFRDSRGQTTVLTVLFLSVLLGMTGIVLDVGSWYHAKRALQAKADAAALAGAQALPESVDDARALAVDYAGRNGGTLNPGDVIFSKGVVDHDTISVHMTEPAPGFFTKLFGFNSVDVGANAAARTDNASEAKYVAPIVVNWKHPMLQCSPLPCPGPTEIDLADLHKPGSGDAAGSFGLINLDHGDGGSVGAATLGEWIVNGFNEYMPLGDYSAVPSAKFNSSSVRDALDISKGQVLLFPIYKTITGPGENAVYSIIGWVGFRVSGFTTTGSTSAVYGSFTRRISEGIQATTGGQPDYGVRVVQLVN
jgi:Putative Flp pilus-assembly TadE/G-like